MGLNDYKELVSSLEDRIDSSYLLQKHSNYLSQLLKIIKYLCLSIGYKKVNFNNDIHCSHPYFINDVCSLPEVTVTTRDLAITPLRALSLLLKFWLLLFLQLFFKGRYKAIIYGACCIGILYYNGIPKHKVKVFHFHYYAFIHEIFVLLYLVKKDPDISAHYHEYMSFLDDTACVSADVIYHPNEITSCYAKNNNHKFSANSYIYSISQQDFRERAVNETGNKKNIIGIYSSGFHKRSHHEEGIEAEESMLELVREYSVRNPEKTFILYIHLARGVESYEDALSYYNKILECPNISLMSPATTSTSDFQKVNLGITVNSNIFWDRLMIGMKTMLINPFICKDFINATKLQSISAYSVRREEAIKKIDYLLYLNEAEFMDNLFN